MVTITASLRACGQLSVISAFLLGGLGSVRGLTFSHSQRSLSPPRQPIGEAVVGAFAARYGDPATQRRAARGSIMRDRGDSQRQIGVDAEAPIECSGGPKPIQDMGTRTV